MPFPLSASHSRGRDGAAWNASNAECAMLVNENKPSITILQWDTLMRANQEEVLGLQSMEDSNVHVIVTCEVLVLHLLDDQDARHFVLSRRILTSEAGRVIRYTHIDDAREDIGNAGLLAMTSVSTRGGARGNSISSSYIFAKLKLPRMH